ncbi:MAG: hypothetical protein HQ582_33230 [Planctomycetes bacterium]|nr:hypothetical protein [Planctomycetota bacterium]
MLGVLAAYVAPALFFDLAYSPHVHWLLFFLAGLTVGSSLSPDGATASRNDAVDRRPVVRRPGVVLAASR